MIKAKSLFGVIILSLVVMLVVACAKPSPAPEPTPAPAPAPTPTELKVKDAAAAWNTALDYLRKHQGQNAPGSDVQWQEQDITPPGLMGSVTKEFASSEWTGEVSYAVLPLERTIYQVTLSSIQFGWHWEGSVKADGTVADISAFKQMSEEESRKVAEDFVRNSPTFVFDGIEGTLRLANTLRPRCPYCWVFIFEFDSEHAGYGDRTGQVLTQVITPHEVSIAVERLEITSAVMDNKWDMINQIER